MISLIKETRRKSLQGNPVVIAVAVAAVLGAILLLSIRSGEEADRPGETGGGTVQANQTAAAPGHGTLREPEPPPELWLQASGSSSGNPAWGHAIRAPFDTLWVLSTGREIFSPPAFAGGRLFMAGNDSRLRAIHLSTGAEAWSRTVACGVSGGVAADSSQVYYSGQDGYLYALNSQTGAEVWKAGLGYHLFTDAAVFADTLILAGNSMGSIAALNRRNGSVVWSGTMEGFVIGPAFKDSVAVFATESGVMAAWKPDGTRLWSRSFASQPSAPSISEGRVIAGFSSGKVLAFSLLTGETIWETQLNNISGRTVLSRPAIFRDSLVVGGTCDGRVYCLDASSGSLIWQTGMENWVAVTPAVCDTIVYASCDDGGIHLLSLTNGLPLETLETGSYSGTPPVLIGEVLYAGNSGGDLIAVRGTLPENLSDSED